MAKCTELCNVEAYNKCDECGSSICYKHAVKWFDPTRPPEKVGDSYVTIVKYYCDGCCDKGAPKAPGVLVKVVGEPYYEKGFGWIIPVKHTRLAS
jgi:hypothetical protein